VKRLCAVLAATAALAGARPAGAETLIGFTDANPTGAASLGLGFDFNAAAEWTQSVAASNVTVQAVLETLGDPSSGNWWITRAIGPAATAADVVAAGKYTPNHEDDFFAVEDFNALPRVVLATGLDLAPGSYFLVLGAPSGREAVWAGDTVTGAPATLAPGFAVDGYQATGTPAPFGPSAAFTPLGGFNFDFELIGSSAPEPGTWSLMILGFGLAGAALRRRARGGCAARP